MKRFLSILLSLSITAIFLVIALYSVNFSQLLNALINANHWLIVLATLCTTLGYVLRAARWQRFLAPSKNIPLARLFPVLVIGFALNNLLPGRPGEFARPYWLGQREQLSRTLGFGTIVVERVADGIVLIAILSGALFAFKPLGLELPYLAEEIALVAALIFGVALLGIIFLLVREQWATALLHWFTRFLPARFRPRVERMFESFIVGLHSLRSPGDVALIGILSLAIWCAEGASYFLILSAFSILPSLSAHLLGTAMMMALVNLGIMIPAAPGGLGPYEAAAVFALGTLNVSETTAASAALASHSMQYLLITGLGIFMAWREGISLLQKRDESEE